MEMQIVQVKIIMSLVMRLSRGDSENIGRTFGGASLRLGDGLYADSDAKSCTDQMVLFMNRSNVSLS